MKQILIGFAIAAVPLVIIILIQITKAASNKKQHATEIARLKAMLADRMDLESEGLTKVKQENEELKKQNENLRISMNTLSQKPGRKEIARLEVYQKAVDRLTINSPGFGPAWQAALKESEVEFEKTFFGIQPLIRRVISVKDNDVNVIGRIEDSSQ